MNLKRLKTQLISDEGCKYHVYKDSLGKRTCGIGHLITANDAEFHVPLNTPVSEWRVEEFFDQDIDIAINDCKKVFPKFDLMPCELQEILINMIFNLGINRFKGFKKMIAAIEDKKYLQAAKEMKNSKWFQQVPNRATRLINRMIKLSPSSSPKI